MAKVTNPDTNPGGDANSMNIDTGQFRALREEVTALTQQVEQLNRRLPAFEAIAEYAFLAGRDSVTRGWSGQARRPRHLNLVADDTA